MTAKTLRRVFRRPSARLILAGVAAFIFAGRGSMGPFVQAQTNPISAENAVGGNPSSEWDVSGSGDSTIQGFATDVSVNTGQTVSFKVKTDSSNYRIDIYRLGYYGGMGARLVAANVVPSAAMPQVQPACLVSGTTGLGDCGNWGVSASWSTVGAVSGIYVAKLKRTDTGGASHMVFVVRDDARQADVVVQTSDTTWQAYNQYGGGSLYCNGPVSNAGTVYSCAGRATKVSYNRPIDTRGHDPQSFVFNAEYPMVRWLEANGYDVKYISGVDTERRAGDLVGAVKPKAFFSVGHDEYWSAGQRASVEAARTAGVSLAFFSGNEMYWKTRFESSTASTDAGTSNPAFRTLVSYKDTLGASSRVPGSAGFKLDPLPGVSTGTWRDTRFGPTLGDGGRPENSLTGTIWTVNSGTRAITVPGSMANLRFWRNTRVAALLPGGSTTLGTDTLGYEWDEDLDNGARPDGLMHLSSTTVSGIEKILDFGETIGTGTATHSLTLYRHDSGALVFGAGTVQWAWGLDGNHDRGAGAPDLAMQQATLNLLADMGAQPATRQALLTGSSKSTDIFGPTSIITSPAGGTVGSGDRVVITGTAADSGGIVAGVEVSVDGGTTWRAAQGTAAWSFEWAPGIPGSVTIRSRAVDDSGNRETPGTGTSVSVVAATCPCPNIWSASTVPPVVDAGDESPVELGLKFRSDVDGFVKGVRFYKSAGNSGTHIGNLWTSTGTLMATTTFTAESASGWQEMLFNAAVPVTANATYIVSYHTNVGHYSASGAYFSTMGFDHSVLHALPTGTAGGNGVFLYGVTAFPTQTFNATNYWVDVVFDSTPDTTVPMIADVLATPLDSSTALVTWTTDEGSTSRVDYSTSSSFPAGAATLSVSDAAFVTAHSVRLTGLNPSTAYFIRVRSTDRSGNEAAMPSLGPAPPPVPGGPTPPPPLGFATPNPILHDTLSVDFAAGSSTGTYVAESGDGEVTLAPAKGSEFSGTTMPAGWATTIWSLGGSATLGGGKLTVDGARVASCVDVVGVCQEQFNLAPGTSLEYVATFTGDPYQHSGLGQTLESSFEPFGLFSTSWTDTDGVFHSGGSLGVRTYNGSDAAGETRTNLGPGFLNAPHRFRIDWLPSQMVYSIDGVQVASHSVAVTAFMRPVAASDFNAFSGNIVVDWVRTAPYAASGTFLSRVFDATTGVNWNNVSWVADLPAGTTLAMSVRTGGTATPDSTWSAFAPVVPGAIIMQSRYIQYRAVMTTADLTRTPSLAEVMISGIALAPVPPPPMDQTISFAPLGGKTFGDAAFTVGATSSSGLPVTFVIASGPATIAGNLVTITGAGTVTVRASAGGGSNGGTTYRPATDVDQSFVVSPASQTITFGALAPKTAGAPPFGVSATASSGLPVTFSIVSGPATIAGSTVTITGVGTVKVRASQTGNGNYAAAIPVEQSFTVSVVTSTVTVSSNNSPSLFGVPITLTATVSPTAATGAVSFKDGATAIVCATGSSLNAPVATCKTSLLAIGTHAITAVYVGNPSLAGSTSAAFSQAILPSAVLSVQFITHEILDGTNKPKVKEVAVANALVRAYRKSDVCANGLIVSGQEKIWGKVFDGLDGYHAAGDTDPGCPVVTTGTYRAEGTTDANGNVNIIVPPALNHPDTDYVVIGRTLDFDDTRTVAVMDPLYSEKTLDVVKAGTQKRVLLHQLRLFNGRRVPGRDIEEFGTYLAIVEPEYMDWSSSAEQYPFVLIAEGDWGLETSITPPEGFVADEPVLSTQVADTVSALQFNLTDIGSDWTKTGITHVITHKGETRIRTSAVPMFNKQPNAENGDNGNKTDTQKIAGDVKRPLLPSRIIAKLMGMLF